MTDDVSGERRRVRHLALGSLAVLALAAALLVFPPASAPGEAAANFSAPWGDAHLAVPAATNLGTAATVTSVSCASTGHCVAGGYFDDGEQDRAFVASQDGGVWEAPTLAIPPLMNSLGEEGVMSVSCPAEGHCVAGGQFRDSAGVRSFVVSQVDGEWGEPVLIVANSASSDNFSTVSSVSCSAPGFCLAGGTLRDSAGLQAYVVSQEQGLWGAPVLVLPEASIPGQNASVLSVSCSSDGNCAAGGLYDSESSRREAFVIAQREGVWGKPVVAVPETLSNSAIVTSVSCGSDGHCVAGGHYEARGSGSWTNYVLDQGYVVSLTNGVWGSVQLVGPDDWGSNSWSVVKSVSCVSTGNCVVAGEFGGILTSRMPFATSQSNGVWGAPQSLLDPEASWIGDFRITSVSCASAGTCVVGGRYGYYAGGPDLQQAIAIPQWAGEWGDVQNVGHPTPPTGGVGGVNSVSCPAAGNCVVGGQLPDGWGSQAFVASQTRGGDLFTDVPASRAFAREIEWLAWSEVTNGYADGTFRPLGTVNRDAMAAFLYRFAGEPAFTPPTVSPFSDVSSSTPFYKEITWLASTSITGGFGDGTFRPSGTVNRDAMAAFLYRFAGKPAFTPPTVSPFSDVSSSTPFYTEITWLASTGVTGGFSDGTFRAQQPVKRDAMAAFLFRFEQRDLVAQ